MEKLSDLIAQAVKAEFGIEASVELTRTEARFGDFASNISLKLSKELGKNPREIAEALADKLRDDTIAKVEVAGPGFLNITLTDAALLNLMNERPGKVYQDDSVVIETNNPNPFKAMHIGHAFNAILGDTIASLIEQGGANIYRVSYHGDVGTHVGKSMYALLKYVDGNPEKLENIEPSERNSFMSKMYAEGSRAFKEDESAKAEIERLAKMSFTREDEVYSKVYDIIFNWSFEQIDSNIALLGNKPTVKRFLESEAEDRGVKIVRDHTPGVFKESSGALVFEGSKHGSFDNAFVSSRGNGLYAARDLGLIQLKNEQYHPDKSFIVTAEEQKDYFKGVIAAAELCMPDQKEVTENISTGTVKLASGKMSSRDGDVVEIEWLFEQIAHAMQERGGNADPEFVAGALRYEFLKVRIGSDVVFDIEQSVSLQGNSGPYLQYAHARAHGIISKSMNKSGRMYSTEFNESERSLVRKIGEYSEVLEKSIVELMPHYLANYLFELAQEFNRFYEKNKVIGSDHEVDRIRLVGQYKHTLAEGLRLLGIHAPDKM